MEWLDGRRTMAISDRIVALYERCYSRPPWSETSQQLADYAGKLAEAATRPGFTALTVTGADTDEDSDAGRRRLLGVCYGWPTRDVRDGERVHSAVISAFGADRAAELIGGAFAVAELFVDPDAQRQGIGRRLMRTMVDEHETAWLVTHTHAPAARLYRSLGWEEQGLLPADFYRRLRLSLFTLGNSR
ncbi:GNAT family N-acetyltransferase [Spirillospora sp. NBC_00431]